MNVYDHLPPEERRLIVRWRAITTGVAITVVLGLFALLAAVQPGSADAATTVAVVAVD